MLAFGGLWWALDGAAAVLRLRSAMVPFRGCGDFARSSRRRSIRYGDAGPNAAGKTTIAKLLCRLYDPQPGAIKIHGVKLRDIGPDEWRSRVTAVFHDLIRFELPLRDNVAPAGAPDDAV